ncbi:hypothetical protein BKA69DRAFT_1131886 [Paraphysoderma sedebokerense]|nr:hypothetical protein BKA69DRAFT_1131886 [Paraphysoderma sedebokerense]
MAVPVAPVVFSFISLTLALALLIFHSYRLYSTPNSRGDSKNDTRGNHFLQLLIALWSMGVVADMAMATEFLSYVNDEPENITLRKISNIVKVSLTNLTIGLYIFVGLQRLELFQQLFSPKFRNMPAALRVISIILMIIRTFVSLYARIIRTWSSFTPDYILYINSLDSSILYLFFAWMICMSMTIDTTIIRCVLQTRNRILASKETGMLGRTYKILFLTGGNIMLQLCAFIISRLAGGNSAELGGFPELLLRIYYASGLFCLHNVKELASVQTEVSNPAVVIANESLWIPAKNDIAVLSNKA